MSLSIDDAKRRILTTKDKKRYVLLSKKRKLRVKDDISERKLIQWIIKHLKPKRRKPKESNLQFAYPPTDTIDRSFSQRIQLFDHSKKEKDEFEKKIKSLEDKLAISAVPALPPAAPILALPPAAPASVRQPPELPAPSGKVRVKVDDEEYDIPSKAVDIHRKAVLNGLKDKIGRRKLEIKQLNDESGTRERNIEIAATSRYNEQIRDYKGKLPKNTTLRKHVKELGYQQPPNPSEEQLFRILAENKRIKPRGEILSEERQSQNAEMIQIGDRIEELQDELDNLEGDLAVAEAEDSDKKRARSYRREREKEKGRQGIMGG